VSDAGTNGDNLHCHVRCSTPLCGRAAVGYASRGLLPKCAICMRRNMHDPITAFEMRYHGLIVIPSNTGVSIPGGGPGYAPRECADLSSRMLAESSQFEKCRDRHDQLGNTAAALVAERARQRLKEYALELSDQNASRES
jgi:hypothetical protein